MIKSKLRLTFTIIIIFAVFSANCSLFSAVTKTKTAKKSKITKSGLSIFPDAYSELDEVPMPASTEDANILKHLEKARQKYVKALSFIQSGDTLNATRSFDEALQYLNKLVSYPGIEQNEDFTDLAQSIIDDYETFIKNINDLSDSSPFFIIRDKFFQQVEKTKPKPVPQIQTLTLKREVVPPTLTTPGNTTIQTKETIIPLPDNESVQKSITFLTENPGRKFFSKWLERSGKWFPMMKRIANEELMPEEIIYLSMIESGLNPNAVSRSKAVGLWQFIRTTGEMYSLNENQSIWVDERRDPEKATRAAMRHLRDLYSELGDWHLALAAYNCGLGGVKRAMKKFDSLKLDYWTIREKLPNETRNYVPLYIAAAKIAMNPEAYGFKLKDLKFENEYKFDVVQLNEPVSLDVLAKCVDNNFTEAELRSYNPELLRPFTPPDIKDYPLKIPAGKKSEFTANFVSLKPEEKHPWISHTVSSDESLTKIAKKYGVSKEDIVAANDLKGTKNRLESGTVLRIPVNLDDFDSREKISLLPGNAQIEKLEAKPYHVVKKGETLFSISRQFNVPIEDLKKLNNMNDSDQTVQLGMKIILPDSLKKDIAAKITRIKNIVHKVRKGETLAKIADDYNVSIESITKQNKLKNRKVHSGQSLTIQVATNKFDVKTDEMLTEKRTIIHKVKKGENLTSIAGKYGVSEDNLKKWNSKNVSGSTIVIGSKLKIYEANIAKGSSTSEEPKKNKKNPKTYTVRKGDTLSSISGRFGVSISALKKANNHIKDNQLRIGQKLRIQ